MHKTHCGPFWARDSFRTLVLPALLATLMATSPAFAVDRAPSALRGAALCTTEPVWQKWQRGLASWYGQAFQNLRTASGERFDMNELTAAHPTLPFGTQLKVRNPANGRAVVVRVNDRGPFTGDRSLDLSRAAASALGILNRGTAQVELLLESSADKLGAVTSLLNSAVACNN